MNMLREAIRAAEKEEKMKVPGCGDPAGNGEEGWRFGVEKEGRRVCEFLG